MSFRVFIYYCTVLGGWAALVVWAITLVPAVQGMKFDVMKTAIRAGLLGLAVAATVGGLDAVLNSTGAQRMMRITVCGLIGLVGGFLGGFVGQFLADLHEVFLIVAWILVGVCIGGSIGVFDVLQARARGDASTAPVKKVKNGVLGGFVGGLGGGLLYMVLQRFDLPHARAAVGLVVLGMSIGLMIGLAQVFLKEAWLKVEAGFRAGREVMLTKDETTLGRAESCDLGLFGDQSIDRLHARIRLQDRRYLVEDNGSQTGTFVNDQRVTRPTPLKDGDAIRVGGSTLRFGERVKK